VVRDAETNQPLPGVNVVIVGTTMGAATASNGEYFINNVPPGTYAVRAGMIGYTPVVQQGVKVSADYTTALDFRLSSTVLEMNEVVVVAQSERVQRDLTSSTAVVRSSTIEALPVVNVGDVLDLQAGFVRDAGGQLHIRGGRATEIMYLIDGVQVIDPLNRQAGLTVDNQAIEELQAISGTFNAEYGQALSGVINIVTKSGSEQLQGTLRAYFGDYFSTDTHLYSVLDDPEWARAAAEAMIRQNQVLFYKGQLYTPSSPSKPTRAKKGYLNTYNPVQNQDIQLNVSGPVPRTKKRLSFFLSGRYFYDDGYFYGKRYFMPWGFQAPLTDTTHTWQLPDGALVPLNWNREYSLQSKIKAVPFPSLQLSYGFYYNRHDYKYYSNDMKYCPDGMRNGFDRSSVHVVTLNHQLSPKTFYELKANFFHKFHENYLYQDPYDYRYVPTRNADLEQFLFDKKNNSWVSLAVNTNDFLFYGNQVDRGENTVSHVSARFDLTSQVTSRHQVKTGVEVTLHDLENEYIYLQFGSDYRPIVMPISSPYHNYYHHKPKVAAAYIQDKAEFKDIIFNVGLRFDYFEPDGEVLADPTDPQLYNPFNPAHIVKPLTERASPEDSLYTVAERKRFWFKKAKAKYQLSPRLGIAFPITDRGVIHVSYGHFFQNPPLNFLYENPEFEIYGAGATDLIGNADLGPERTVMYEIGLQQAVGQNFNFDVTGFYRDIRDWIGISFPIDTYGGRTTYTKYVNKDYAAAQGIALSGRYQTSTLLVGLDYTYMSAEGTTSDALDAYNDLKNQRAPRVQMVNLNWDQTHTLNLTCTYRTKGWLLGLIGRLASGMPYTPTFARGEVSGTGTFSGLRENSERMPPTKTFDVRLSKEMRWKGIRWELFVNCYNIFDTRNVRYVYTDTGTADYTLESVHLERRVIEISDAKEYFAQPGRYYPPRLIQWGVGIGF